MFCHNCIGVPVRSVQRLLVRSGEVTFESPKKRYEKSRQRIFVDSFDRDAIRRKIHRMHEEKKHLTLDVIRQALRTDGLFPGGRSTLAKELKKMGFSYKRINNKRYISISSIHSCL